jgi:hypothetical protein
MCAPQRRPSVQASTICYRDSFTLRFEDELYRDRIQWSLDLSFPSLSRIHVPFQDPRRKWWIEASLYLCLECLCVLIEHAKTNIFLSLLSYINVWYDGYLYGFLLKRLRNQRRSKQVLMTFVEKNSLSVYRTLKMHIWDGQKYCSWRPWTEAYGISRKNNFVVYLGNENLQG